MNKVILSGNLTRDPEVRYTQSGKALAKMGIAVNRPFSRGGEGGTPTVDFFNLTAWEKTAEFCGRYLQKGSRVLVEGRIQNDNYEKDGVKHYSVNINVDNIEFAGGKPGSSGGDTGGGRKYDEPEPPFDDSNDDVDVPF